MLKLVGVILMLCACLAAGSILPYTLNRRIALLIQLEQDLCIMTAELKSTMPSIPELLETVAEQSGSMTEPIYTAVRLQIANHGAAAFCDAWKTAVACNTDDLTVNERQKLENLGMVLGYYVLSEELRSISDVIDCIRRGREKTMEYYGEKCKLSFAFTTAIGLFLVIALI